jgi:hypothetical protein
MRIGSPCPRMRVPVAVVLASLLLAVPLRAQGASRSASADSAAVLAAVQRLFDAMLARDTAAARALLVPGARMISVRGDTVVTRPRVQGDTAFIAMLATGKERLLERFWQPVVHVQGPIASVWTPYDFHVDGAFSHCGIDAVSLVKVGDAWKIATITWTVQRRGCAPSPLGPPAR